MFAINKNYIKILFILFINILFIYRIQIQSNFNLILGDVSGYDTTIQASILEHWFNVFKFKTEWQNVGYFYPYQNTIAQTDAYFLISFFYIPFRIINLDPYISAELTGMILKILGFLGTLNLSRRIFNFNLNYALVISTLFTLNNATTFHGYRLQLATVAFVPWILTIQAQSIKNYFQKKQKKATLQLALSSIFFGFWCLTCLYIAWFYFYFLLILIITLLFIFKKNLYFIFNILKENAYNILIVLLFQTIALLPFILTFYLKSLESGARIYQKMKFSTMSIENFFQLGKNNKFYTPVFEYVLKYVSPNYVADTGEYYNMGINFFAFIIMIIGLTYLFKIKNKLFEDRLIIALIISTLIGMISISRIFDKSPWFFIYSLIPGAKALNIVSTFMYILCLPIYISVIYFIKEVKILNIFKIFYCILLILFELNTPLIEVSRPDQVQKNVNVSQPPTTCKVFYVGGWKDQEKFYNYWEWINNQYAHNVSAMMISQLVNVPTINGFASFIPMDYDLVGPNGTAFSPNSLEYEKRVANYFLKYNLENVCKLDLNSKMWKQVN